MKEFPLRCEAPINRKGIPCGKIAEVIWEPRGNPNAAQPMCTQHAMLSAGNFKDEIKPLTGFTVQ